MKVKGIYVLLFSIKKGFSRHVGSLGLARFTKGNYAYVGSAQSSLLPRLARHFARGKKRLHWHIDYLTASRNVAIKGAIYSDARSKDYECLLSQDLSKLSFSISPIPSFGSTDCKHRCRSHLYLLKTSLRHVSASIVSLYEKLGLKPMHYHPDCTLSQDRGSSFPSISWPGREMS